MFCSGKPLLLEAAIVAAASVFLTVSNVPRGFAHDAPRGWSYPFACCSGIDCREVSRMTISESPEGYVIKGTGEVVSYADNRVKNSPDGEFHWCTVASSNDSRTICLFVPPRSF